MDKLRSVDRQLASFHYTEPDEHNKEAAARPAPTCTGLQRFIFMAATTPAWLRPDSSFFTSGSTSLAGRLGGGVGGLVDWLSILEVCRECNWSVRPHPKSSCS
jgi:hypothetical protein